MSKKPVLIHTETVAPEKRFIRTDGGLYTIMLLGVLFTVGFGSKLALAFNMDEQVMHWTLYGVLIILGIIIYRTRLLSWRYTLTSEGLFIDRLSGKNAKAELDIPLSCIEECVPYDKARLEKDGRKPGPNVRKGPKEQSFMVLYTEGGVKKCALISPSQTLRDKLEGR